MARYGQRPENALKRANEFIEVGKPARALDTLQEVFRNKKWAYNWSESVLEPIMFKYLDLCVELKKSHIAKEGLFQYRNMFQSVNVGSLENVIRGYLRMAEEKTENAREQSAQAVIDIDDLDNLATPESILLSAVSGEDAQDRSDRTILTPWVKFLWESYCQCLELLRTNAHVETLYHDIARMAFQFCLKYNRKTEFRKLCDKLRKHLEDICKLPQQAVNVSISKPETQQLNLETRLYQLDSAIQMELWQEAYKAIEDIHGLMSMSKKFPVPKTMANYYQKLAMVFWKAGNYLFHAAALFKLFQLSKEMKKNITVEELQRMACRVLIATLSIPLPSAHPEFDRFIETDKSPLEKAQRLAVLLGLSQPPTRASLLKDIVRVNVVSLATPQLQDLYNWLEIEFHPLLLCGRVHSVIEVLANDEGSLLQQYIPALQDVTLVRLVRQVAQVYQTIQIARLLELAKFTDAFHLERLLVDCVRHNDMQIRIDHGKQCIHFGMDLSESQREDKPEGPTLQSMPSEQIRNQLVNMASVLYKSVNVINPTKKKIEREKLRLQMVQLYHENKVKEHHRILQRHKIIEDRKEYIERLNTVREEEELRRQEEAQRQILLAEHKRLEQEREERERKRQQNEIQQIKDRHLKEKMQQISQTSHGQKVLKKLDEDEIKKLDAEQIAAREAEELHKERRELQAKLKSQEKKNDYYERAKRLEEIPLLKKAFEEKQKQDKEFWEQQENERIQLAIEERKLAVANRERLSRMKPDQEAFLAKLKSERNSLYEDKLKEFEKLLAEERAKRLAERAQKRKEDRRAKWLKEKMEEEERKREEELKREEEERRKKDEEERRIREEEERAAREEKERIQKEMVERAERAAAIQRKREEEIEQKLLKQKEESLREREKDSSWRKGSGAPPEKDVAHPERRGGESDSWRGRARESGASPVEKEKKSEVWRPSSLRGRDRDPDSKAEPIERDTGRGERDIERSERRIERGDGGKGADSWRSERRDIEPRKDDHPPRGDDREDRRPVDPEERRIGTDKDDRRERDDRRDDRRGDRRIGGDRDGERRFGDRNDDRRREDRFERRDDRDRDRGFTDRGDRFGDRGGSRDDRTWRKAQDGPDDGPIRRGGGISRGGPRDRDQRGGGGAGRDDGEPRDRASDWRKESPREDRFRRDDDRREDRPPRKPDNEIRRGGDRDERRDRGPISRGPDRGREQPAAADGEDGAWQSVGRRR